MMYAPSTAEDVPLQDFLEEENSIESPSASAISDQNTSFTYLHNLVLDSEMKSIQEKLKARGITLTQLEAGGTISSSEPESSRSEDSNSFQSLSDKDTDNEKDTQGDDDFTDDIIVTDSDDEWGRSLMPDWVETWIK